MPKVVKGHGAMLQTGLKTEDLMSKISFSVNLQVRDVAP